MIDNLGTSRAGRADRVAVRTVARTGELVHEATPPDRTELLSHSGKTQDGGGRSTPYPTCPLRRMPERSACGSARRCSGLWLNAWALLRGWCRRWRRLNSSLASAGSGTDRMRSTTFVGG